MIVLKMSIGQKIDEKCAICARRVRTSKKSGLSSSIPRRANDDAGRKEAEVMRYNEQNLRFLPNGESGLSAVLLGLARDVRRVIHHGSADPDETVRLTSQLNRLRESLNVRGETPLDRWFDSLQRQIDSVVCEPLAH